MKMESGTDCLRVKDVKVGIVGTRIIEPPRLRRLDTNPTAKPKKIPTIILIFCRYFYLR